MTDKKKTETTETEIIEETVDIEDTTNLISIKDIIDEKVKIAEIEVKRYLPLEVKMQMVDDIVNSVTSVNENGMLEVDYKVYDLMFTLVILREFTNLNLHDIDIFELYNKACKRGIVKYVYGNVDESEIEYIRICVEKIIEQKKTLTNNLENVIDRNIKHFIKTVEEISDKLINQIPTDKEINKIIKKVGKINPDNLTYINSFMDALNGKKKEETITMDTPKMTKEDKEKLNKLTESNQ